MRLEAKEASIASRARNPGEEKGQGRPDPKQGPAPLANLAHRGFAS